MTTSDDCAVSGNVGETKQTFKFKIQLWIS